MLVCKKKKNQPVSVDQRLVSQVHATIAAAVSPSGWNVEILFLSCEWAGIRADPYPRV